ncbi:hypothetical protein [Mycobacterium sp. RTGN5]|uniref:hypothetical protein n=1 Tax=Mycobacterium sp. RTGN5 TaxID=3016522 RepID=UPI0029C87B6A|nr:hypothetical protein [Mycobacterium sp. RTGN5]
MSGQQSGIRARLAVFSGAALGGVYWGLLSMLAVAHQRGQVDAGWITPGDLLIVIATSVLTLLAGVALLRVSRTAARTAGVALIICALSGWVLFGTVAFQSSLWRA